MMMTFLDQNVRKLQYISKKNNNDELKSFLVEDLTVIWPIIDQNYPNNIFANDLLLFDLVLYESDLNKSLQLKWGQIVDCDVEF